MSIQHYGEKRYVLDNGQVLYNVHTPDRCAERTCIVHSPTNHHMREWYLLWRSDRGIFERTCPHGIGHPDPDQFTYWRISGRMFEAVHGCDGCCKPPNASTRDLVIDR